MTTGQKRLEGLAQSDKVEPEDFYNFLASDLGWFLLGITLKQYEDLLTKLNTFDKKRIGLWLKK